VPAPSPIGDLLGYAGIFARFPRALRRFIRDPLTLDEARRRVRAQVEGRGESLVRLLRESVYANPGSPYLALLGRAGCQLSDVQSMVADLGVDGTLRHLRDRGVYVTFEEFKGRRPIERAGMVIPVAAADFDNPRARHDLTLTTSGSTGQANLVYQDLDHVAALAVHEMVGLAAHGVHDAPTVHWSHIMPGSGIRYILQRVRHGQLEHQWFSPTGWRDTKAWRKYAAATRYMLWWMRRFGVRVEDPVIARPGEAAVVARAVRGTLDRAGRCLLRSSVSQGVRVALAARAAGFDLAGTTMRVMSEPLTPAKRQQMEASGARVMAGYGSIETGSMALGCANGTHADDVHLLRDAFALIDHPYTVPGTDTEVRAFNLTSLRDSAPKVMLNYQIDDHGVVEPRACGCDLEAYGYDMHVHSIRSYTKLVGEGVTLVGNDLMRILEDVLPGRFGGTPLDYQLQEDEDAQGLTRLVLAVSPQVVLRDEGEMVEFLLHQLRETSPMTDAAGTVWRGAGTLSVARREPVLSARGKFQSLYVAPRQTRSGDSDSAR
jgi:hypothetical protein